MGVWEGGRCYGSVSGGGRSYTDSMGGFYMWGVYVYCTCTLVVFP